MAHNTPVGVQIQASQSPTDLQSLLDRVTTKLNNLNSHSKTPSHYRFATHTTTDNTTTTSPQKRVLFTPRSTVNTHSAAPYHPHRDSPELLNTLGARAHALSAKAAALKATSSPLLVPSSARCTFDFRIPACSPTPEPPLTRLHTNNSSSSNSSCNIGGGSGGKRTITKGCAAEKREDDNDQLARHLSAQLAQAHEEHAMLRNIASTAQTEVAQLRRQLEDLKQQHRELEVARREAADKETQHEVQLMERQAARATLTRQAEDALSTQLSTLASQLTAAHKELASLKTENTHLKRIAEAEQRAREAEVEAARAEASSLQQKLEDTNHQLEQVYSELSAVRSVEECLQVQLGEQQAAAACKDTEILELKRRVEVGTKEMTAFMSQLQHAKAEVSDLYHRLSTTSSNNNSVVVNPAPSPLAGLIQDLKMQLGEKEAALISTSEDLLAERRKASELQQQALEAAAEAEDLRLQCNNTLEYKFQLAGLKDRCAQLEGEVMKVKRGGVGMEREVEEARQAAKQAREECEAKELEVMALQGELEMMRSVVGRGSDAENWLMSP